jgi:hypothetical protein
LGFIFSPQSSVKSMERSMLWMPVINGALCAAYITAFLTFGQFVIPTILTWTSIIVVTGLWFTITSRKIIRDGIARKHQLIYGIVILLAGCAFAGIAQRAFSRSTIALEPGWSAHISVSINFWLQVLWQQKLKIGLFATCLLMYLVLTAHLPISPGVRGILAGLPIVPFGGLVSVAGDSGLNLSERTRIFEVMTVSVWLGPAVAIWFIYGYSKYLNTRRPLHMTVFDAALKFAVLIAAWFLCGVAILGITYVLPYLG